MSQAQADTYEEEYENYDEFDDDEDDDNERGLSGLVVLLMGVVMLGAFASIVWIAYQQGMKSAENGRGATPYVSADPDPLKIENEVAAATPENDRAVYDRLQNGSAPDVETIAAAPEEPVTRSVTDPIAAIASDAGAAITDDAANDRIESLASADAQIAAPTAPSQKPAPTAATPAAATSTTAKPSPLETQTPAATVPAPAAALPSVSGGTHLVQVGAFKSQAEADGVWTKMQTKLGDYLSGKSPDVEMADLGSKGVFYRLRIGPFGSADEAKTYCEGLKSRGQDCLIKAK
jgi:cell division protein FtsN